MRLVEDINSTLGGVAWLAAAGGPAVLYEGRSGTRGTGCGYPGPANTARDALRHGGCSAAQEPGGIGLAASFLGSPDAIQGNHANMKHSIAGSPGDRGDDCASLACHTSSDKQQQPLTPQMHRVHI